MAWQRWNGTSHIFELSIDEGVAWNPLPLNASIITEGTINIARLPATTAAPHHTTHETGGTDAIAALSANILTSGTVPDLRFPATLPVASGVNLTSLNASNLASGTVADARLSSNVPLKNVNNIFSGIQTSTGQIRTYVGANAAVSVPNTTFTAVVFNTENYDIGNCWSPGSPTALFCPAAGDGFYLIIGVITFSANSAGARFARLAKNTINIYQQYYPTTVGDVTLFQVFMLAHLVAGDYIQLILYQSSGTTLDAIGSSLMFVKLW